MGLSHSGFHDLFLNWNSQFLNNVIIIKTSAIGDLSQFWLSNLGPFVSLLSERFLIIWLSSLSILSIPDQGFTRNTSCALNLISVFLLTLAGDPRIYISMKINFFLRPRKLVYTNLCEFTVLDIFAFNFVFYLLLNTTQKSNNTPTQKLSTGWWIDQSQSIELHNETKVFNYFIWM